MDGLGAKRDTEKQWQALAVATYVANMLFIKLSIAVFLLRLSARKRRYTYTLWASMAVVAVWCTVAFFWDVFQCSPVQAQWDYTVAGLRCAASEDVVGAAYSLSALSIATDWLYALLPIPMVWNAHMTPQAKTTVVVILGLGLFASVATLIRLKFLADINDTADLLCGCISAAAIPPYLPAHSTPPYLLPTSSMPPQNTHTYTPVASCAGETARPC